MMSYVLKIVLLMMTMIAIAFANPQFLVITDIHYGINDKSQDGQDTGLDLLTAAMTKLQSLSQQANFIVNLGDLPTHGFLDAATKGTYERQVFHDLKQADSAKKPMFYIFGNNDSLGGNYQSFTSNGLSPLNFAIGWEGACLYCHDLLIDGQHMNTEGYYSSYVIPHNKEVMLIALNTVVFTTDLFNIYSIILQRKKEGSRGRVNMVRTSIKTAFSQTIVDCDAYPTRKKPFKSNFLEKGISRSIY